MTKEIGTSSQNYFNSGGPYFSSWVYLCLTLLSLRCENENCPLQITNVDAFLTTERIEQSRAFEINCLSVVRFRF